MRGSASARLAGILSSNTAGGMDVVAVACRQLEVSALGSSLVQRSPYCDVCVIAKPR